MERIPQLVLDQPVDGSGLHEPDGPHDRDPTLRDQLDPQRATLVLFLRHFGCLLCREMVKEVRIASEQADSIAAARPGDERAGQRHYPRVVFVHHDTYEAGSWFFGRYWPGAIAISDPDKTLYRALGLERASLGQLIGPRVWSSGLRATLRGHALGRPRGDVRTLPGVFLLAPDGRVLHRHLYTHVGDHPDFQAYADQSVRLQPQTPQEDATIDSGDPMPLSPLGAHGP